MSDLQTISPATCRQEPAPEYVVGQDRRGQWLAVKTQGHSGGLFVTRDAALRFAVSACDHRAGMVRFAEGPIELRI